MDNSLESFFEDNDQVFKDAYGNYRFFGGEVNNYIKLNGNMYRIVGLINGKIKVVGEAGDIARYVTNNNYLTVEDYVLSFDKHDLKEDNLLGNESWLNIDYRYWLESDNENVGKMVDADVGVRTDAKSKIHYQRIVREVDGNVTIEKGNGSISNPYEVSYGS